MGVSLLVNFIMRFCFRRKDPGKTRTTFPENMYDFSRKHVRVFLKRSFCFWGIDYQCVIYGLLFTSLLYGILLGIRVFRIFRPGWSGWLNKKYYLCPRIGSAYTIRVCGLKGNRVWIPDSPAAVKLRRTSWNNTIATGSSDREGLKMGVSQKTCHSLKAVFARGIRKAVRKE